MESRSENSKTMERATRLLVERGRVYSQGRGKYISLRVFTKSVTDLDLLKRVWGGNAYRHPYGNLNSKCWVWMLGNGRDLVRVADQILPFLKEEEKHKLSSLLSYCEHLRRLYQE